MITRVFLIRHTQTIGNIEKRLVGRTDFEVSDDGKKYINLLTNRLKDVKFDKIYSSTSKRAIKTVENIAKLNNLEIIQSEALCEMYFGVYDGMTWEEVDKINPKISKFHLLTNEICLIPNQETTEEVANRMYDYIEKVSKDNIGNTILIVSHGVAIEAFLRKVTKESFVNKREEYSQKNTSLNILEYDNNRFQLKLLNDISHLSYII